MNNLKNNKVFSIILTVLIGITLIVLLVQVKFYIDSKNTGLAIGESFGTPVGKFEGSISGLVEAPEAYEEGKKAGLSAEDTQVVIKSSLDETEKLEVLIANVKLTDFHTIGGEEDDSYEYAALYMSNAQVIFTIDLSKAKYDIQNNEIKIVLPLPESELIIDNDSIEKKGTYLKYFFTGSSEDGYTAFINSYKKVLSISTEELNNYEILNTEAKEAGKKQVEDMVDLLRVNNISIVIEYEEA